jgi:CBS domain-containing protein
MKISDIVRHKGAEVVTITPDDSVRDLLGRLAEHNIGALVVVRGETVVGIVSERDVVRRLHRDGNEVLSATVGTLMTPTVITARPDDSLDSLASAMTDNRIRHVPILSGSSLVGIVSIGDVVAGRIRQLEAERHQLETYITHG